MPAARWRMVVISIHALREESDFLIALSKFVYVISIHALREESDLLSEISCDGCKNFYPRSP